MLITILLTVEIKEKKVNEKNRVPYSENGDWQIFCEFSL